MRDLVLGIDGGGSKTLACLADSAGTIVFAATAPGSNPVDNKRWRDAFAGLAEAIAPWRPRLAAATLAIGGYHESPVTDRLVDAALPDLFPGLPLDLENDVYVAHDAAFLGGEGVLLIAGTGSMAVMRGPSGPPGRVGGWGDMFGDEGSAHWLGREALSLASRSFDGRATADRLANAVLAAVRGDPAAPAVSIFNWTARLTHPRSQVARLSRVVADLAADGDADARALLDAAIDHLAAHVEAGRRRSGLGPDGPWSLLGGLSGNGLVRAGLEARLGPMRAPALPPCGGALWRAARRAGWPDDAAWRDAIRTGIDKLPADLPIVAKDPSA